MPAFAVDGIHLSYDVRGEGFPVVLLHGFTSRSSSWEAHGWVDLLVGSRCRTVTLDVRSHGESDRVFEPVRCSTAVLARDVFALLDHLEIEEAALIGFSMGGGIALRVAMDAPSRVSRLLVAGVGDAALNALHAPLEIASLADAFSGMDADGDAARIRRNAEVAGNDLRALLPFLQNGGWPGGLSGEFLRRP
jgi:pimeloyl-ACP methyl ester carboxylesterase